MQHFIFLDESRPQFFVSNIMEQISGKLKGKLAKFKLWLFLFLFRLTTNGIKTPNVQITLKKP